MDLSTILELFSWSNLRISNVVCDCKMSILKFHQIDKWTVPILEGGQVQFEKVLSFKDSPLQEVVLSLINEQESSHNIWHNWSLPKLPNGAICQQKESQLSQVLVRF